MVEVMKTILSRLVCILVAGIGLPSAAQQPDDPLSEILVPPHLIFQHAAQIGLSDQQKREIGSVIEDLRKTEAPGFSHLQKAREAFAEQLGEEAIDEAASFQKLNELHAAEGEMKRFHLKVLLASNRILTAAQKAALREIRGKGPGPVAKLKAPDLFAAATPEALRSHIDKLRVPGVAWRKIPWKTCLLEGIAESAREKKPIILWVFIDLPIDDKRC